MAFQYSGFGVSLWRLIASIGIGVELVTIDTYVSELVPERCAAAPMPTTRPSSSRVVPIMAFIAWQLVPVDAVRV